MGRKRLDKYILYMIPFVESTKTKPVRGQDSSGRKWVFLDADHMAVFNLYKFIKVHTYDFSTFLSLR